jgi:hypothetical protein
MYIEETKQAGSTVEHVITAETLDAALEGVKKVFADYHALGYGTAVVRIAYRARPGLETGYEWHAVVKRSRSCD